MNHSKHFSRHFLLTNDTLDIPSKHHYHHDIFLEVFVFTLIFNVLTINLRFWNKIKFHSPIKIVWEGKISLKTIHQVFNISRLLMESGTKKVKRVHHSSSESLKNLIDVVPYRVRLSIISYFKIIVCLILNKNNPKRVVLYHSTPFYSEKERREEIFSGGKLPFFNKELIERYGKSLARSLFGYFKTDFTQKIFPLFVHFRIEGQYSNRSLNFSLPKYRFHSLRFCGCSVENGNEKLNSLQFSNISFGSSDSRFWHESTNGYINDIKMLTEGKPVKGVKIKCDFLLYKDLEPKSFFGELNLENLSISLTKLQISGTVNNFFEVMKTLNNLKKLRYYFFYVNKEIIDFHKIYCFESLVYPKLISFEMEGFIFKKNEKMLICTFARMFPNLTRFINSRMKRDNFTTNTWKKFFEYLSKKLNYLSVSLNDDFEQQQQQEDISHICCFNQMEVLKIRNTRIEVKFNFGFFLNHFPNITSIDIERVSSKKQSEIISSFKKLRELSLRNQVRSRRGFLITTQLEEEIEEILNPLKKSNLEILNVKMEDFSYFLSFLEELKNLKELSFRAEFVFGGEYIKNEEEMYNSNYKEITNNPKYQGWKEANTKIFEESKKKIHDIFSLVFKDPKYQIQKLRIHFGGNNGLSFRNERLDVMNEMSLLCFDIIKLFKEEKIEGHLIFGNIIKHLEIGRLDENDCKTLFLWKEELGICLETDYQEYYKEVEESTSSICFCSVM